MVTLQAKKGFVELPNRANLCGVIAEIDFGG
jgi:hypothetical protein